MNLQALKGKIKHIQLSVFDAIDLEQSKSIDVDGIQSVCLALGPYRNLTTLTASILFLHPNCQVLNHAGARIYNNQKINFLLGFNKHKLDRFIQFAIKISGKGQRGNVGGSITHSHAFDSGHKMKELYNKTGSELIKDQIQCLFWKESLRTSNLIHENNIDLTRIFKEEKRLRFLMPVRNPLDCAVSSLKTGHVRLFKGLNRDSSIFEALQGILDEIYWFESLKSQTPDRFFNFFEHSISREMLVSMAEFLELEAGEDWINNSLAAMDIKSGYDHDQELVDFYRDYINKNKSEYPELSKNLLVFIGE